LLVETESPEVAPEPQATMASMAMTIRRAADDLPNFTDISYWSRLLRRLTPHNDQSNRDSDGLIIGYTPMILGVPQDDIFGHLITDGSYVLAKRCFDCCPQTLANTSVFHPPD
jgi:hypothetical protein